MRLSVRIQKPWADRLDIHRCQYCVDRCVIVQDLRFLHDKTISRLDPIPLVWWHQPKQAIRFWEDHIAQVLGKKTRRKNK